MSNEDRNIELYTLYAQRMIKGRQGEANKDIRAIYGFIYFASEMTKLWIDAEKGNPYAVWWLSKINDRQNNIESLLGKLEADAEKRFKDGLTIDYKKSPGTPEVFKAYVQSPYSWKQARFIKRYDNHCLKIIKQNAVGLLSDDDMHSDFKAISNVLVSCMSESVSYVSFDINIDNIIKGDSVYESASEKMGVVPKSILNGDKKADYLPKNIKDLIYRKFV